MTIVTLCGSTRFSSGFRFANLEETLHGNIVFTIGCDTKSDQGLGISLDDKERLDQLHLRKIDLSDEILVINRGGYIGQSTLHEICYAFNSGKSLRFQEPYVLSCPVCQQEGLEQEHFFCNPSSVEEISHLAQDPQAHPYLVGQLVRWMGQVVPVVQLVDGSIALQVDMSCPCCSHARGTSYLVQDGDNEFTILVDVHGNVLASLFDADERVRALRCSTCQTVSQTLPIYRRLTICDLSTLSENTRVVTPSQLPNLVAPLHEVISASDFDCLVLRSGTLELTVASLAKHAENAGASSVHRLPPIVSLVTQ